MSLSRRNCIGLGDLWAGVQREIDENLKISSLDKCISRWVEGGVGRWMI